MACDGIETVVCYCEDTRQELQRTNSLMCGSQEKAFTAGTTVAGEALEGFHFEQRLHHQICP